MLYFFIIMIFCLYTCAANMFSYKILKNRILGTQAWDLNICCGKTDGGGINADIFMHLEVPGFIQVDDIYNLPFKDKQFDSVLCSHTMEHIDNPEDFFKELSRVGREITIVIPPLYDMAAVFNIFEHKWIFLSFRKKHKKLPVYIRLPFSSTIQKRLGQLLHA